MTRSDGAYIARRMDEANPGWITHYDRSAREFIAIPARHNPARVMIAHRDPGEVIRRMRKTEELARVRQGLMKI